MYKGLDYIKYRVVSLDMQCCVIILDMDAHMYNWLISAGTRGYSKCICKDPVLSSLAYEVEMYANILPYSSFWIGVFM